MSVPLFEVAPHTVWPVQLKKSNLDSLAAPYQLLRDKQSILNRLRTEAIWPTWNIIARHAPAIAGGNNVVLYHCH